MPPERALGAVRHALLLGAATMAVLTQAHATPLCRWVDDTGRTHLSDAVPEKFRASATCTDSSVFEPRPEDRAAATKRAAADRERARIAEAERRAQEPTGATRLAGPAGPAASAPRAAKRPARVPDENTDCRTWWRLYDQSAECFGPWRNVNGSIKPEAFERCNLVQSPEPKCGLRRWEDRVVIPR